MKKYILFLLILTLLLSGCKKKPPEENNVNPPVNSEVSTNNEEEKVEENKEENGEETTSKNPENDENVLSGSGLFIGLDGANMAVIITKDTGKDVSFNTGSVDFANSDIEIGDVIEFTYTADKTDLKTLKSVKKAQTE